MTLDFRPQALQVLQIEATAVTQLAAYIDESFNSACQMMFDCTGRVIVIGMGKSGHIANKIAATLASTGTPAFFVHPAEASHGDFRHDHSVTMWCLPFPTQVKPQRFWL